MVTKTPRTTRVSHRSIELTKRDLDLLTLIGLARGATTTQIARMLFPSEDRARRTARRLFNAGMVDVTLTSSTHPNFVTLTKQGKDVLVDLRPTLHDRIAVVRPPALHAVRHHALVVDLRLYLVLLERQGHLESVVVHSPPQDLVPWRPFRLIPDGVAELVVDSAEYVVALEADRGTEQAVVFQEKTEKYVHALDAGLVDFVVVGVEGEAREVGRVARVLSGAGLGHRAAVVSSTCLATGDPSPLAALRQRPTRAL